MDNILNNTLVLLNSNKGQIYFEQDSGHGNS